MNTFLVCIALVGTAAAQTPQAAPEQPLRYTVPAGTHVLMALQSPISTKHAQPGSPVYAQTTFPIVQDGHVLIPAGSYVQGTVDRVQRAGRVKGRAELQVHFTTLILANGYTVSLPGSLADAPGNENDKVNDKEGSVKGAGGKAADAGTVAETTLGGLGVGSAIGSVAGNAGKGAVIGLGAGAVAGLAAILLTRGPDIRFDAGTPVEMVLVRPLVLEDQRLNNPQTVMQPIQSNRVLQTPNRSHVPLPLPGAERLPNPY